MTKASLKSWLLHAAWAGICGGVLYVVSQLDSINGILTSRFGGIIGAVIFSVVSAFVKKLADDLKINQ